MPPKKKIRQVRQPQEEQEEEPAQGSKNKGGRPQNAVWDHFIQTPLSAAGHFAAECLYCKKNGHADDHKNLKFTLLKIVLMLMKK